ncbi:hypothetical protein Acor_20610 [Acrocarpospora corrugata]|uniref:Double-GTPase 2 domain-containing protein n=1 Tax=Acrocarpospora corrugata TaxID=35763 RepID=A0A5M3W096_9ACTN|nr:hypothetical protein [Acrocarpospora corrugata]GER99997.1 hypothetical protein Acor_20610 [Acrocarpospora corrugata]
MHILIGMLIGLIFWAALFALMCMVGLVLFPIALVGATAVAVTAYCQQAGATLLPDTSYGPSPVARPDGADGREPAYRHYLVAQVWADCRSILAGSSPLIRGKLAAGTGWATRTFVGTGERAWLLLPLWLGVTLGIVSSVAPVAVLVVLIAAAYLVTVAVGLSAWIVCVGVLRVFDQVLMLARRILQACPYAGCYKRFTLPVYACSTCGAKHAKLRPDLAGAFWHVCQCGTRLPTTILLGRYRLQAHCPACARRLPGRIGRVRIEPVPLVGGPDAGKTTFMALAVDALHDAANAAGGSVLFADTGDENTFRRLRRELAVGKVSKTLTELPKGVTLDVTLPKGGNRILYLFDPSGEHHTEASKVEALGYLAQGEALILVIDPFALPAVQDHLLESESNQLRAKGVIMSREDPADTFSRLRNELAARADGGGLRRVSVVLTKADLLRTTTSGRGVADDLPGWLGLMGLGSLVRELKNQRVEARYFLSGLPPDSAGITRLFGWLTGLRLTETAGSGATSEFQTGELRRPWQAQARPEGRPPLSYLITRRGLAAVTVLLSVSMIILLSLTIISAGMPQEPQYAPVEPVQMALVSVPAPKEYAGRWSGKLRSDGETVTLTLRANKSTGTVRFTNLKCTASVSVQRDNLAPDRLQLFAEAAANANAGCPNALWFTLAKISKRKIDARIFDNPSSAVPLAAAVLTLRD